MSAAMSIRQHWSQRRPRLILQGWQTLQLLKLCCWHLRYWSYRGVITSSVRQSLIYCHCYTVSVGCNVSQSSCYWNHITFFSKTVVCTKFSNYTVKDQNPTRTRVNVNSLIRAGPSVLLMSPAWRTGRAVLGRARNIKYLSHQTKEVFWRSYSCVLAECTWSTRVGSFVWDSQLLSCVHNFKNFSAHIIFTFIKSNKESNCKLQLPESQIHIESRQVR